jgi:O-antigen/teichoic acid export membrane protein
MLGRNKGTRHHERSAGYAAQRVRTAHPATRFVNMAFFLMVADLASKSASPLLAIIMARYFDPATYGEYATAVAVVGLFMTITSVGFEQELTRRGGRDSSMIAPTFRLVMVGIMLSCASAALVLAAFLLLSPYSDQVRHLIIVLGLAAIAMRHVLPFRYLCLLLGNLRLVAVIQSLAALGLIVLTVLIIAGGGSVVLIAYGQLVAAAVLLLVWLRWMPHRAERAPDTLASRMLHLVRDTMSFTISNALWVAYYNFDTFLLSLMREGGEVGTYALVYRIVAINYVIGYALANSFTPTLFDRFAHDRAEYARAARRLSAIMLAAGVLTAVALFLMMPVMMSVVFGSAYAAGIPIAQLLSVAVLFRMVNFGLSEILTTSDRQKIRILLEGGMLAVNVMLNCALIPRYGAMGAAAATVIAEVFLFLGAVIYCKQLLYPRSTDAVRRHDR